MVVPSANLIRNVAVVGHKGSGKTALVEAMLLLAGAAPKGVTRDAHGHFLDDTPEEKAHGATLESRLEPLHWGDVKVNLIDTPGDASALSETRLALGAVDAALLVVSAKEGIQSGTERVLQWLAEAKMPFLVALTRVDDARARVDEVVLELRQRLHLPLAMITLPMPDAGVLSVLPRRAYPGGPETAKTKASTDLGGQGPRVDKARAQLAEDVAATDDALTEKYLEASDLSDDDCTVGLRSAVRRRAIVPMFVAASTQPKGILALLDGLVSLVPPPEARTDAPLEAYVFKTHIDPHSGRASYTRIFAGVLHTDDQVVNAATGQRERIGALAEGSDKNAPHPSEAVAGDIVAIAKLKTTHTGETLSDPSDVHPHPSPGLPPRLFSRSLQAEGRGAEDKLADALDKLVEEDPALSYALDEVSHLLVLSGLGATHLDLAVERLKRRSGIQCKLGPPRIAYRETLGVPVPKVEGKQKKQTGGHGQYAVCYLDVEPLDRGQGFQFVDAVVGGTVPRQFIGSVEKGIHRALAAGPIAGFPVVDVRARLYDGKSHSVDSSDAAFQTAGYRAMRAALASGSPVLLEPHMSLEVTIPSSHIGDVMGHLNGLGGRIHGQDSADESSVIKASAPLEKLLDYEPRLSAMTQGRGTFAMTFSHYEPCSPQLQAKIAAEASPQRKDEDD
ncbi:MAG: elongation factor G [Myxococcales bacterium]|nr:elongation factor G [Myxococcales bacterium]